MHEYRLNGAGAFAENSKKKLEKKNNELKKHKMNV